MRMSGAQRSDQGYLNAVALTGGAVSWQVVSGAYSFDREEP